MKNTIAALVAACALLLTGCGASTKADPAASSSAAAETKAAKAEQKAEQKASASAKAAAHKAAKDAQLQELGDAVYATWLKNWGVSSPSEILAQDPSILAGYVSDHKAEAADRIAFTVQTEASKDELKKLATGAFGFIGKDRPQIEWFIVRDAKGNLAQVQRKNVPLLNL